MVAKTKRKYARKGKKTFKKRAWKGKKRLTFKKQVKGKTWKKKTFKKKSYKAKATRMLASAHGDQSMLINFVDKPAFTGTTNAVAKQFVWGSNTIASAGNVTLGQHTNLCLDAGNHLEYLFQNVIKLAAYNVNDPPSGTKDAGANIKLVRRSSEVQCRIVNLETCPVELWEYRIMARRDQTLAPGVLWYEAGQMESNASANTPAGAANLSAAISPSAIAGGGYATPVGVTPYMLHSFVSQYKILKVKKRELAPARVLRIKYSFKKPKLYSWANILAAIGGPGYTGSSTTPSGIPFVVRKGQCASLFIAKGTFAQQNGANAGYASGIGNVNLGFEYQYRYHYNYTKSTSATAGSIPSVAGFNAQGSQVPLPMVCNVPQLVITPGTGAVTYQLNSAVEASSSLDVNIL